MPAQPMPAAERDVSPDLARRLLAAQHPDLAALPVRVMANGWDNLMCRLGTDLVVRLPRRSAAADLVLHEQRWLPVLAPRLPVPVPVPVRVGHPGCGYPWSWSVLPHLAGDIAARTPPRDPRGAASALGRFLGALHAPAPATAPANPVRGVPLAARTGIVDGQLSHLAGVVDRGAVLAVWRAALAAPAWTGPPVWLHGDLHPANILVHHGRISGVLDFGDITAGDPATDLAVAWMMLPPDLHREMHAAYRAAGGPGVDAGTRVRARGWALTLAMAFLAFSADSPLMARIGHDTLGAVLAGPATAG